MDIRHIDKKWTSHVPRNKTKATPVRFAPKAEHSIYMFHFASRLYANSQC